MPNCAYKRLYIYRRAIIILQRVMPLSIDMEVAKKSVHNPVIYIFKTKFISTNLS